MSAIDKLRAASNLTQAALDLERKGAATATYGDHIDAMSGPLASVAVIELADRLDKLEAAIGMEPPARESPPVPFRVTGPGKYRQQNGECVDIVPSGDSAWPWQDHDGRNWDDAGVRYFQSKQREYLIEGPLPDEPELSGLTGFTAIGITNRGTIMGYSHWCSKVSPHDFGGDVNAYVDWSKVPANAIVKPDKSPSPRRVAGWMNLFGRNPHLVQGAIMYPTRELADKAPGAARRIACVEINVPEVDGLADRSVE